MAMGQLWIDAILEPVYAIEVPYIKQTQEVFKDLDQLLINVSTIGDPGKAFYLFFPLIYGLHRQIGLRYMGTVILCEWLNQVLKWLFHGHRPYWWVNIYAKDVTLYQTPITCETGPGNPSGHVMLNLVLGLALVNLVKKLLKFDNDEWSQNDNPTKLVITRLLWNAFYVWTASVIVSRIYIAAHFPHQCLYAVGFGYFAFEIGFHQKIVKWTAWSFTKHIYLAGFFLGSALLVYTNVEKYLGFDINWSITLANKFCQKKEWIYIDTTPLYTMMRYSGSCLGLAISMTMLAKKTENRSTIKKILSVIIGITIGLSGNYIHNSLPQDDLSTFYLSEYVLNAFSLVLTTVVTNTF